MEISVECHNYAGMLLREGKDLCILGSGHANLARVYRFNSSFA